MKRESSGNIPVLVTGGEYRIALSVTRSLGRRGIPVAVLASSPYAITFHSRYCRHRILTPPDYRKGEYLAFLEDLVRSREFSGILFCDDLAALHVGSHRDALAPHVPFLLPPQEYLELAMSKKQMLRFAVDHGIPAPATAFPDAPEHLAESVRGLRFPLIVKGTRGDSSRHLRIIRSGSGEELEKAFRLIHGLEAGQGIGEMPVVQEYVSGEVYSAIVLCEHGTVHTQFLMRKILSFPDWGGICVEGESVFHTIAMAAVNHLIAKVHWHGIAEVEFILDERDGAFKLIELNPDFNWGIDFAIDSGVDFPYLAFQLMRNEQVSPLGRLQYRSGRRFLWFLPEGIKYMRRHPASIPGLLLKAVHPNIGSDLRHNDLGASLRQLKRGLWNINGP